ncbi:MAG TPA: Cd(II)/Pb(II)-responsive transcriptional regulator [Burkholderiales bacterium]|nr:Cd(II)/Pb(II)-responsive transcriptional regulator [Burkholderiales bacterium]
MKIGELATGSGCSIETIRYYEREGLLPPPVRTSSNYRDYDDGHVELLGFVRHCRSLDMGLADVQRLLAFRQDPQAHCADVNGILEQHIAHVAKRLAELQTLQKQLLKLRARCRKEVKACGVLQALNDRLPVHPSK